ncbi:hypothetical protein GCM10010172_63720 [Paractinoplanes ferrugineus]|uniref:Uncharacterized protein n=1 Tax=Paractinoplanes ferrugineus TaxID=113564 RepID=A0A919J7T4_9ACTN|nr:hypothetical protein [Actinoplanes ferrugineus]GIE16436.1 hypothetical protein Afe05nite_82760 [Actinoplanes ferrugineus]
MSDDQINPGLRAYADQVQRTAELAPAAEIRRRGDRRRRNRAVGASFAVVLIAAVGVGTLLDRRPHRAVIPIGPSPAPSASAAPSRTTPPPSYQPSSSKRSDVTQLRALGIDLRTGVLIDVADDGEDSWMQVVGDVVDFTGDKKDNSTRMSLQPAPVAADNSVLIIPPAQPGMCVTDTTKPPLALQPCKDGNQSQIWKVVPAGDSGQFELQGRYDTVRVQGRVGLQTIKF